MVGLFFFSTGADKLAIDVFSSSLVGSMDWDFVLKTREIVKRAFLARASECQAGSQLPPRGQTFQNLLVLTAENRESVRMSCMTHKPNARRRLRGNSEWNSQNIG